MLLFQNCTYSSHLLSMFNCSAKFIRLEHEKIYFWTAGSHLCNCLVLKKKRKRKTVFISSWSNEGDITLGKYPAKIHVN